jgi:dipeptidyl aminopeptidase/acylaminoacyl peptidase
MKIVSSWAALAAAATVVLSSPALFAHQQAQPDLIPRDVLFGNPDRAAVQLSPDGAKISYLAPVGGVMNVWVAPIDKPEEAKPVTRDTVRGIRQYFWAFTNSHILYMQDKGGDENWHLYSVDISAGNKEIDLTPFETIPGPDGKPMVNPNTGKTLRPRGQVQELSDKTPDQILITINDRDPRFADLYRADIRTGKLTLVEENKGFVGFATDSDFVPRYAFRFIASGGLEVLKPAAPEPAAGARSRDWNVTETIPMEDAQTTSIVGFSRDGTLEYNIDSRGRNTSALTETNTKTGQTRVLFESPQADVSGTVMHPRDKTVQAVSTNYTRTSWTVLDKAIEADFAYLEQVADGDVTITSRTLDDTRWIVAYLMDNGPVRYYRYDRTPAPAGGAGTAGRATFLFTNRKAIENTTLATMTPVVIKSRDGLSLVSYLTLPVGAATSPGAAPASPLPMVLNVHGGPWARDSWGFSGMHQWLANRGYAVLSVNYRGSTGFGKNFINAANSEWARKMHDDLLDAVKWAVESKIADPARVGIMGGSYGGYATLVGVTFTPDQFACGVDIVGPSSLVTLMKNIPEYWIPIMPSLTVRVGGDPRTEEGRKFLELRSPLSRVADIKRPLLIGQGANDPRVTQVESDQIVQAMQEKKIPVTYVLYPDEGHGFARPENRLSFFAVSEAFLAEHLGGRYEPIGDDFTGSSITVPAGADQVPGVADSLHK